MENHNSRGKLQWGVTWKSLLVNLLSTLLNWVPNIKVSCIKWMTVYHKYNSVFNAPVSVRAFSRNYMIRLMRPVWDVDGNRHVWLPSDSCHDTNLGTWVLVPALMEVSGLKSCHLWNEEITYPCLCIHIPPPPAFLSTLILFCCLQCYCLFHICCFSLV